MWIARYGSNCHRAAARDEMPRFRVADKSETRAKKVNKKPELLGYSTRGDMKIKKEQEQKWIDLCLDHRKSQHP